MLKLLAALAIAAPASLFAADAAPTDAESKKEHLHDVIAEHKADHVKGEHPKLEEAEKKVAEHKNND